MPLLRLLSASLFASTCILQAAAQTPTPIPAPTTPHILITPLSPNLRPLIPLGDLKPYTFQLNIPKILPKPTLSAQTQGPCYTLRAYGFTAKDLQSSNPHSSSYTECTPASRSSLKAAQIVTTIQTASPK